MRPLDGGAAALQHPHCWTAWRISGLIGSTMGRSEQRSLRRRIYAERVAPSMFSKLWRLEVEDRMFKSPDQLQAIWKALDDVPRELPNG
jgi:hypothetical protein